MSALKKMPQGCTPCGTASFTKLLFGFFLILLMSSCVTYYKATEIDPETNYFPAYYFKETKTIKEVEVNYDSLKSLLVVPSDGYLLRMAENMHYFDTVLTFEELQSSYAKEGTSDSYLSLSDTVGLKTAYKTYRPFTILNIVETEKPFKGYYAGLLLYHPGKDSTIFQNEIRIYYLDDAWSDQKTMYPLFNSLLDYLRKQKSMSKSIDE